MITTQATISPALAAVYRHMEIRAEFEEAQAMTEHGEAFGIEKYRQARRDAEDAPTSYTCGWRGKP